MEEKEIEASCSECGAYNCYQRRKTFPAFCLTEAADPRQAKEAQQAYVGEGLDARIAQAAAEVEGRFHGKLTRVEEIVAFARRLGARRIGIATCLALIEETRVFAKILRAKGLEPFSVVCKVGSLDKTEIGVPEEWKIRPNSFEAICNPVLQAKLLNAHGTELNVIVGLCVGHDSLFLRHAEAPVTTLITKDRMLGNNPAAALYTCKGYYSQLLKPDKEQ